MRPIDNKSKKIHRIIITVTEDMFNLVTQESKNKKISKAEVVRRYLDKSLKTSKLKEQK